MVSVRAKELLSNQIVRLSAGRTEKNQLTLAKTIKKATKFHLCSLTNHGKDIDGSRLTLPFPIGTGPLALREPCACIV